MDFGRIRRFLTPPYYIKVGGGKWFFICFILGFIIRLVPEVISFPYPIGFDTVYYVARIKSGVVLYHWSFLLYAFLVPIYSVAKIDPFLLLKLTAPILYGLNVSGIYYFAQKALHWDAKKAFIAAVFFAFQLAALRISWDLHRNMLGLAVLLFTLPWIRNVENGKGFTWFIPLSILVVFSHEYAAIIMFAAFFWVIINDFLKGERVKMLRVAAAILPALVIFLSGVYFYFSTFPLLHTETNIINASDTFEPRLGGLFFLTDYLNIIATDYYYPTYLNLVSHVLSLFILLYLLCLPLVFAGFFRDSILDSWTLLLLVGSFSLLVTPFCALYVWNRWMLMLVFPFTFYAVNGIEKVLKSRGKGVDPSFKRLRWMKVSKRIIYGILLFTILLGSLFIALKYGDGGIFYTPNTISYFPSTMLQNTVPLQDVKDTIKAIDWLNERMNDGSCALIHHAFISWARLYLDNKVIINYARDTEAALNVATEHCFYPIYLIWWNENIGWYDLAVPKNFEPIFSSGRISVFKYSQA